MKYLIASDIHGSLCAALHIEEVFIKGRFDFLVLLGDLLYHGPRNDLPKDYNPKSTAQLLNKYATKIIACRGNCEAEVDQMLLSFPVMSDYVLFADENVRFFATHGHIYKEDTFPFKDSVEVYLTGHTHIQKLTLDDSLVLLNPGSVSLPKQDSKAGYATYENHNIKVFDMTDTLLNQMSIYQR